MLCALTMLLYIPIALLAKFSKIRKFQELKRAYEFGVLITTFIEAFLEFTLLSFLNLTQVYIYIYILCPNSLNFGVK